MKVFVLIVLSALIATSSSYEIKRKRSAIKTPFGGAAGFPQLWNSVSVPGPPLSYNILFTTDGETTAINLANVPTLTSVANEINAKTCLNIALSPTTPSGNFISFGLSGSAPANCEPLQFGRIQNGGNPVLLPTGFCSDPQLRRLFLATLGLHYTHQRADRSHHVAVVPQSGATFAPRVSVPAYLPETFSVPYDFLSIMSVPSVDNYNFFKSSSTCSVPTAVTDNTAISELDFHLINKLYGCTLQTTCSTANPCVNGASCFDTISGAPYCHCPPGYTGATCATNSFTCSPNPCLNSGTCTVGTGGVQFTCSCTALFTGKRCETSLLHTSWTEGLNGYQYMVSSTTMTWLEANKYCLAQNSELAFTGIRNPASYNILFNNVAFNSSAVWIGLTKFNGIFKWTGDGIPSNTHTWTKWGSSQPDTSDDKLCSMVQGASMQTDDCTLMKRALCEKPIGFPPAFNTYKASNNLIYFLTPPMTFYAAKRECQRHGAWLAVDGVATSALLLDIANNLVPTDPSPAPKFFYVGFEDTDSPNEFKPVKTGTSIGPGDARWSPLWGDPNNHEGIEDCVATKRDISGKLVDIDCGQRRLRHGLCEMNAMTPVIAKGCKCDAGYYWHNGNCIDVNECAAPTDPCGASGHCINCMGSYTCHCTTGSFNMATGQCA